MTNNVSGTRNACNFTEDGTSGEAAMIPKKLRSYLQHRLNPVHIYCRLCDFGLAKANARRMIQFYAKFYSRSWLA